jgi:hypothetical protein
VRSEFAHQGPRALFLRPHVCRSVSNAPTADRQSHEQTRKIGKLRKVFGSRNFRRYSNLRGIGVNRASASFSKDFSKLLGSPAARDSRAIAFMIHWLEKEKRPPMAFVLPL